MPDATHPQVISHLYELYGNDVASMLDGFFAFVILDTRTNRHVVLCSDFSLP